MIAFVLIKFFIDLPVATFGLFFNCVLWGRVRQVWLTRVFQFWQNFKLDTRRFLPWQVGRWWLLFLDICLPRERSEVKTTPQSARPLHPPVFILFLLTGNNSLANVSSNVVYNAQVTLCILYEPPIKSSQIHQPSQQLVHKNTDLKFYHRL